MTNKEILTQGWDVLFAQAQIIAMLPLEEWLQAFDRAETLAPIVDPTLYRDYIYDPEKKGEAIKSLIEAALPLKRKILELQRRHSNAGAM
jgi:hypothetical protein